MIRYGAQRACLLGLGSSGLRGPEITGSDSGGGADSSIIVG